MKKLLLTIILLASAKCYASEWEHTNIKWNTPTLYRLYVPHGWLITTGPDFNSGVTFYADEKHEWKL